MARIDWDGIAIVDMEGPVSKYKGFYIGFKSLMRELHIGIAPLLRILKQEGVRVIRVAVRTGFNCFIHPDDLPGLIERHGSRAARKQRMRAWGRHARGVAPMCHCPHCGKTDKQWRGGKTTAGNRRMQCGHCKGHYTHGVASKRLPSLEATCPRCGETSRQHRGRLNSAGNREAHCVHCGRYYTLRGNPDAPPPPCPIRSRVELTIAEMIHRAAAWPSEGELRAHNARVDADLRDHYIRMDAELERHAALTRSREIEEPVRSWHNQDPLAPPERPWYEKHPLDPPDIVKRTLSAAQSE